jgi:hypothetical protein
MIEDFSRVSLFERYPNRNGVLAPLTRRSVRPIEITAESGQYVFVNLFAEPRARALSYPAVCDLVTNGEVGDAQLDARREQAA